MAGFQRLGPYLNQGHLNQLIDHLEALAGRMLGRGVLEGLALSPGAGLTLHVSAGAMLAGAVVTLPATSILVPADASRWVFLDADGAVTLSTSPADPGGTMVCLGRVASTAVGLTVSEEGRWVLPRYEPGTGLRLPPRTVAGTIELGDPGAAGAPTPGRASLRVCSHAGCAEIEAVDGQGRACRITEGGRLRLADPVVAGQIRHGVETATLTADRHLGPSSANLQILTCSGGPLAVRLPAALDWGMWFRIVNAGGPGSPDLLVRTAGGTLLSTLAPGEETRAEPAHDAAAPGGLRWPNALAAQMPSI